jgi:SAM-dependent MidA family methyltransferase
MTGPGHERRETALALALMEDIRRHGPITIRDYMARCLTDATHGYYRHRDAIGSSGDFVTAPEISQIFGELLGLWSVAVWQQMGAPQPIHLIEIGPGRGTLMRDMLRAARVVPAFLDTLEVHLVEISPRLRELQQQALAGVARAIHWHEDLATVPPGAAIIIANELLDALPARQCVRHEGRWRERGVGLDGNGKLAFVLLGDAPESPTKIAWPQTVNEGCILELADFLPVLSPLLSRAQAAPLATLLTASW